MRAIAIAAVVLFALAPAAALAAFDQNGLETFGGTSLDAGTWQSYAPSAISQNNGLFITEDIFGGHLSQYTTRSATIGIGGSAQVTVTITEHNSDPVYTALAYLGVQSDSSGTPPIFGSSVFGSQIEETLNTLGFEGNYYSGASGLGTGRVYNVSLNVPYTLRLVRLNNTSYSYSAFDGTGAEIFSEIETWPVAYSGDLYIALGAAGVDAEFTNLQLGGNYAVPEPEMGWVLFAVATSVALMSRRRAGANSSNRCGQRAN